MILICGHCKKDFTASRAQERRAAWRSSGAWACSRKCVSALAVSKRNCGRPLSIRKLAYSKVANAVADGSLIRPDACENCGTIPDRDGLGRSRIEAHHDDHSKPFEIQWLCDACHKAVTPKALGSRNVNARLTEEIVRDIRLSKLSGHKLAERCGVTPKAIHDIRSGKTWRHVT